MRQVWSAVHPYWSILYAVALLLIIAVYFELSRLSFAGKYVFYGLVVLYDRTSLYLIIIVGLSIITWFVLVIRIHEPTQRQNFIWGVTFLILFVAVPFACIANLAAFGELGTNFVHLTRISYGQHLYQLAALAGSYGEFTYNLYRCDSIGYACERIYQLDASIESERSRLGTYQAARTASLAVDPDEGTISIQVNGEIIHTISI